MDERHRDPLELWVGTWTPEEWVAREHRKREDSLKMKAEEQSQPETRKLE